MSSLLKWRVALLTTVALVFMVCALQTVSAAEDLVHIIKGTVKSVDRDSKTLLVKTGDGTEHTIQWTDKTTMEGAKATGEGVAEGTEVSVKYTEKAGEKTAVGIKAAGKATAKAVQGPLNPLKVWSDASVGSYALWGLFTGSHRLMSDSLLRPGLLFDHAAFQGLIDGFASQQHGYHHGYERRAKHGDGEIAATRHLYRQFDARKRRVHTP
jgi:hypothetical protein